MRILSPIINTYLYDSRGKKPNRNYSHNMAYELNKVNYRFMDITKNSFNGSYENLKEYVEYIKKQESNVEKFCDENEKKIYSSSIIKINNMIERIDSAIKQGYDTALLKIDPNDRNSIDCFIIADFPRTYSSYYTNLLHTTLVDFFSFNKMKIQDIETLFNTLLSKSQLNVKHYSDNIRVWNITTNYRWIKTFHTIDIQKTYYAQNISKIAEEIQSRKYNG